MKKTLRISVLSFFLLAMSLPFALAEDTPAPTNTPETYIDSNGLTKIQYRIDENFKTVSPDRFYDFMKKQDLNYEKRRLRSFGRLDRSTNFNLLKTLDNHAIIGEKKEEVSATDALPGKIPLSQYRVRNNPVRPTFSNVRELSTLNNSNVVQTESRDSTLQYRLRTNALPINTVEQTSIITPHQGAESGELNVEKNSLSSRQNMTSKNYSLSSVRTKARSSLTSGSGSSVETNWAEMARFWKRVKPVQKY